MGEKEPSLKPKRRAPFAVWVAWGLVLWDVLGFLYTLVVLTWGPPQGEAALGCLGASVLGFLPLVIFAGIITHRWKQGDWRDAQEKFALQAKANQIRRARRDKAGPEESHT